MEIIPHQKGAQMGIKETIKNIIGWALVVALYTAFGFCVGMCIALA